NVWAAAPDASGAPPLPADAHGRAGPAGRPGPRAGARAPDGAPRARGRGGAGARRRLVRGGEGGARPRGPRRGGRAGARGVCGLLDGVDALGAAGVDTSGRLFLIGGGSRSPAYQRVVADLAQRPVIVTDEPEVVAGGAAVQAAAVLTGATPEEVAAAWDLAE